jgi:BirA family biotin operon repressor/biotin-[acetyl-CoA-carboxylase] ligase
LRRIKSDTWIRQVDFHRELTSTNDLALTRAAQRDVETPLLILAEQQTAGRGRGSNQWWSGLGALTFSLIVDIDPGVVPQKSWPLISLASAVAVCKTVDDHLPSDKPGLKWPNDVYVQRRKICGILAEISTAGQTARDVGRLVLGIGININNSLSAAPAHLQATATSLLDETRQSHSLPAVLLDLLQRLEMVLGWLVSDRGHLASQWRHYCIMAGSDVTIQVGAEQVAGHCQGIADDGALIVGSGSEPRRVYSGVVLRFG